MKIALLHLNHLRNDVTARLESKPDSVAFVCPQGKGVLSASLRGVIPHPPAFRSSRAGMWSVLLEDEERI